MAREDWDVPAQDIFDDALDNSDVYNIASGIPILGDLELFRAESFFEVGWLENGRWLPSEIHAFREAFFDMLGIDEQDFDWQSWREYMGYDDN